MLVHRVTIVPSSGESIVIDGDRTSSMGWGLAPASTGAMEGWWEPPAPRAEAVARPQADGAFAPLDLLVGARVLTIVAHHDCGDPQAEREAREQIARVCRGWLRIVVDEAGRTSHVRGFVSAQAKVTHVFDRRSTWSLVITCPDPLRYEGAGSDDEGLSGWRVVEGMWSASGDGGLLSPLFDQSPREDVSVSSVPVMVFTGVVSSSLRVDNPGTAPTWPVLEVDGPVGWARWTLDEQVVEWGTGVPEGMTLRINTHDGMVSLGAVRIPQTGLVRDEFFALEPGTSQVAIAADRAATLRVRWLPAWT